MSGERSRRRRVAGDGPVDGPPGFGTSGIPSPSTIMALAVGYLVLALGGVAVLDGLDVATRLGLDGNYPVWYQVFQEASVTEWLQSIALLGAVFLGGVAAERSRFRDDPSMAAFMSLLALSAGLLLLEDAGNVTQRIAEWVRQVLGEDSAIAGTARVPLLGLIAMVPLFAVWRHREDMARLPDTSRRLLVLSLGTYAFMAVTGEVVESYAVVGETLMDDIFAGRLDAGVELWDEPGIVFLDYVFEESIEVIASAAFVASIAALLRAGARSRRRPRHVADSPAPAPAAAAPVESADGQLAAIDLRCPAASGVAESPDRQDASRLAHQLPHERGRQQPQ